jgi:hypothetical protein
MVVMDEARKGERYARLFRKAGVHLGKGEMARAVKVLREGLDLARSLGDERMARLFEDEIGRAGAKRPDDAE